MNGKLLNYVESFNWSNKDLDRSIALQNYNDALIEAREVGDQVFCPETMYNPENRDIIFQFMWFNGYHSYEQLKVHYEWLKVEDFQLLLILPSFLGSSTPNSSNQWDEFNEEFNEENRSLLGLKSDNSQDPLVYDKDTHRKFHSNYVATFDFDKQKAQYKYFKEYHKPRLKLDVGEIKSLIEREQVSKRFVRLDPPPTSPDGSPIHGQQIHIHFQIKDTECALNLDGTWKHPPTNPLNDRINTDICSTLSEWGFCLPEDYYR